MPSWGEYTPTPPSRTKNPAIFDDTTRQSLEGHLEPQPFKGLNQVIHGRNQISTVKNGKCQGSCRIGHAAIGPLPTMVRDGVSGVVFAPGNPEALLARVCQA